MIDNDEGSPPADQMIAKALREDRQESRADRMQADAELVKHLVDRFLRWKLPEHFRPDCGVHFTPIRWNNRTATVNDPVWPTGTNLFDANQAEAMVRYMIEGMPDRTAPEKDNPHERLREAIEVVVSRDLPGVGLRFMEALKAVIDAAESTLSPGRPVPPHGSGGGGP